MAGSLDITNGHAARMRFSRFKQQMEGVQPQVRKPKENVPRKRKEKQQQASPTKSEKCAKIEGSTNVKIEPVDGVNPMYGVEATVKASPVIKPEIKEEDCVQPMNLLPCAPPEEGNAVQGPQSNFGPPSLSFAEDLPPVLDLCDATKAELAVKEETIIKQEPM